jgi:hypothetical protein
MLSVKGCRIVFIIGVVAVFSLIEILGLQKEACIFFIGLAIYFFVIAVLLIIFFSLHCFFLKRAKNRYYRELLNKHVTIYNIPMLTKKEIEKRKQRCVKQVIKNIGKYEKWVNID